MSLSWKFFSYHILILLITTYLVAITVGCLTGSWEEQMVNYLRILFTYRVLKFKPWCFFLYPTYAWHQSCLVALFCEFLLPPYMEKFNYITFIILRKKASSRNSQDAFLEIILMMMICSDAFPLTKFRVLTIKFSVFSHTGLAKNITRGDQMEMIFARQMCLISGWNSVKRYGFDSVFSQALLYMLFSFHALTFF